MAIQTIEQSPGLGQLLGQASGSTLSSGIQGLAESKMKHLIEQQQRKQLQSAFPQLPQGALDFLASKPPKEQEKYLSAWAQGLPEQQEEKTFGLDNVTQEQKDQLRSFLQSPEGQQQLQQIEPQILQKLQQFLSQPSTAQQEQPTFAEALGRGGIKSKVLNIKQQTQIENVNDKELAPIKAYIESRKKRKALAEEGLKLVQEGRVTSGLRGLLPETLFTTLDASDARFSEIFNTLANEEATTLRGPVGKAKLEAAQRTKTAFNKPKAAQEHYFNKEIEEGNKAEALEQAQKEIMAEHGGVQPANLLDKMKERAAIILKEVETPELPEDANDGDVYYDDETGKNWEVINGRMVERK